MRKPFIRPVEKIFWLSCQLDKRSNYILALALFYLGYSELTVARECKRSEVDPVREKYISYAYCMGMDEDVDSISLKGDL